MADRDYDKRDLQDESQSFEEDYFGTGDYREETSAELAEPFTLKSREARDNDTEAGSGTGIGLLALALSIISLFVFPVLCGIAGVILGFVARRRGARSGTWAMTIGAISLVLGLFILPFF